MCILFIYRNPDANSESYRLILASNRDEYLKRPALPAHYWKNHPECLGGTDMEPGKEGGTWLALSVTGKAGVVLNLPDGTSSTDSSKQGRGFLIPNFITSNDSAISYLDKLHKENENGATYNPFHLVLINLHNADVHYLGSSIHSKGPSSIQDSILGFGNSSLNIPYKKVEVGKERFKDITDNAKVSKQEDLIEDILKLLKSKEKHLPDPELQKQNLSKYEELSSIFVSIDGYSTRTHSIILVNGNNEITFIEETLMPDSTWKRQIFNNNLICKNK